MLIPSFLSIAQVAELQKMLDDAQGLASEAEVRAMRAEAALSVEEAKDELRKATEKEEMQLADMDADDFDFGKWIDHMNKGQVPEVRHATLFLNVRMCMNGCVYV